MFSISRQIIGQTNIVPNGSFENQYSCPNGYGLLANAISWFSPTNTTTDLYDSCSVYSNVPYAQGQFLSPIYSMSGHAFIGMHQYSSGNREYAQVKLIDTLIANGCYYAEFFTRVQGICPQAINGMGINFSATSYTNFPSGPAIVQPTQITRYNNPIIKDTLDWAQVNGIYTATGNEAYLTIGNFNDNPNTDSSFWHPTSPWAFGEMSYYFVDAVSVYSINPNEILPWSYKDTSIFLGNSVYIGNYMGGNFNPSWYTYSGNLIANNAGITVSPTITSQYVIQFTVCGVPRADTIKVTVINDVGVVEQSINSSDLIVSPNPNNGLINLSISNKDFVLQNSMIKIYDMFNRELKSVKLLSKSQSVPIQDLNDGVYYLQFYQGEKMLLTKKIIKH
ncbi:MAG: T9SS type A sorting domain-containing protein [Bacteroidota bacterium]|nr:T9SS type A sorting domain-containing protein [Bacteroidota bacterium]